MYHLLGYEHIEIDGREKRNDLIFRNDVRQRYNDECVVTGNDIACDVCHIVPYCKCNDNEKYDVNNG
ncbi:MAG: hypothetical protein Dasosvirus4_42, partial [Dasosvirus sp.]